jgi:MtaA/CmuA family methyltransferase
MPITMQFASRHAGVTYAEYASDHRVLAACQVRVAADFDFDHVSAISDPAREAADLGASVIYGDDTPPAMDGANPLITERGQLADLWKRVDVCGARMADRLEAIALLQQEVGGEKLIEGWIEGPCAEAADLRGINELMTDFGDAPEFVTDLMEFVTAMEIGFARRQVQAGADIIGIGDAAASLIGPRLYEQFVLAFEQRMVQAIHETGALVRLHICGNTRRLLGMMGRTGSDVIDLDYPSPMAEGRRQMGPEQVLLGNIDPVSVLRDCRPDEVTAAIAACHADAGSRYIVGAGCEVTRDTPNENVRAMTRYAREHAP